jgi:exopolysaccharide production protein ExoQ
LKNDLGPSGLALAIFFALAPAIAVGGVLGLPVLMCLVGALSIRPSMLGALLTRRPMAIAFLVLFAAWAGLTSLWSPYPAAAQAGKIVTLVALGLPFAAAATANEKRRRLVLAGGVAAVVVLVALLSVEAVWTLPISRAAQPEENPGQLIRNYARGSSFLISVVWAAAGGLAALGGGVRFGAMLALLAASVVVAVQYDQLGNGVAFAVGAGAFALAWATPRFSLYAVSGGLAAWMLTAPFVTPLIVGNPRVVEALPLSWAARAGIWDYVCARILEEPWIGHGLEASRAVTDRIQVRNLDMRGTPVHPHSGSLQIWFETGLIGAALAAAALVFGGRWLGRTFEHNRAAAAAACATLATIGVIFNISFGAWAEWWIATMFVAAALVGAIPTHEIDRR